MRTSDAQGRCGMHMPYTAHSGASTNSEQRAYSEQNNIPGGAGAPLDFFVPLVFSIPKLL